jgi:methyltransferase (TIGR00027 family)
MKTLGFSRTAAYVALLRALGDRGMTSAEGFHDEAQRMLLPSRWAGALAWLGPRITALRGRAREGIIAHVDLLVSRALAIDSELTTALASGLKQVVLLGAGIDSRAHRMTALEAAHVFEVDHPATQAEKQRCAAGLARTCRELTYVACDFERDLLSERLQLAGHRVDEPTIWIWEGVTLYLDDDALRATLGALAACSAPTSTLIVEYHDAEAPRGDTVYSLVRKILLAHWSEPQIGLRSRPAMRAELEGAGFRIEKDFGVSEWGATFAGATSRPRTRSARLAIAAVANPTGGAIVD